MEDDQLIILIKKYLDGNCTAEETQIVESWYQSQKNEQALFYKGDPERIQHSSAQSLQKIRDRITAHKELENNPQPSFRISRTWLAAAAVILVFLISGLYLYQGFNGTPAVKYSEITAPTGQVIHVTLSDHTSIWLNACSRLKYPQTMNGKNREVYLEGEAYFDVFHDASKPFLVHTHQLTTTVLGTAFSVTAYRDMPTQTVTVARGKVQVASDKRVLGLLTPDKRVDYDNKSGESYFSDVSATAVTSWKDGKLQFENQNMQDIAARLDRWYGYSFKFANLRAMGCRYTASFNNKIPLSNLLEVMKAISRLNYKIDPAKKTVTFLGTGCNE
ncbi:MAG TPA: FecR domain-containing protein [Pedobacter sp.]